jgi:hypothetical protein
MRLLTSPVLFLIPLVRPMLVYLDFCDGRRRGCGREKNVNNSRNYSSNIIMLSRFITTKIISKFLVRNLFPVFQV